jgi:hypothetical protein
MKKHVKHLLPPEPRTMMLTAMLLAACSTASAQSAASPEATAALKRMTDYLAGLSAYSLETQNTLEVVLVSGQKLQFDSATSFSAKRPDKFRANRYGDLIKQEFYYDGANLTLVNPESKHYAVVKAPSTIDNALDFATDSLDIIAPASDLLHKDAFKRLTADVTSGYLVGQAMIEGQLCDHLAFRAVNVDWQIWMRAGAAPIPCKYVITTTDMTGMPQFSVTVRSFNASPTLNDAQFRYTPPKGATKIDFISPDSKGGGQ